MFLHFSACDINCNSLSSKQQLTAACINGNVSNCFRDYFFRNCAPACTLEPEERKQWKTDTQSLWSSGLKASEAQVSSALMRQSDCQCTALLISEFWLQQQFLMHMSFLSEFEMSNPVWPKHEVLETQLWLSFGSRVPFTSDWYKGSQMLLLANKIWHSSPRGVLCNLKTWTEVVLPKKTNPRSASAWNLQCFDSKNNLVWNDSPDSNTPYNLQMLLVQRKSRRFLSFSLEICRGNLINFYTCEKRAGVAISLYIVALSSAGQNLVTTQIPGLLGSWKHLTRVLFFVSISGDLHVVLFLAIKCFTSFKN